MSQRFKAGDRVIVKAASPPGHIRTPTYLRGKRGVILGDWGAWPNPEQLAYGGKAALATNYWVQFPMDELWAGRGAYAPGDTVAAEIYEHWLEPDPAGPGEAPKRRRR